MNFLLSKTLKLDSLVAGLAVVTFTSLSLPELSLAQATASTNNAQKLIAEQSTISFVTRQMGVPVEGKFGKIDAQIQFDVKQAANSKVAFTIDTNSATIGDAETIRELKKPAWFDTAKFPTASFVATQVKASGAGKFEVVGNLTIKGVTKSVSTLATLITKGSGPQAVTQVEGSLPVKRLDFKLGDGDWKDTSIVADEVQIKFKLAVAGLSL